MERYISKLTEAFQEKADPENAEKMSDYMQNKFEFFGINAQPRRQATRKLMRQDNRPDYEELEEIVKELWKLPEREFQYFGQELLQRYTNKFDQEIIELFEYMITHKSWWDTVDIIAKKLVGEYFKKFPEQRNRYIGKWINSDNIWLQRTALLFQLGYKEKTDVELLFTLVEKLKDSEEFFIQKAIGWALREYSRIDPDKIEQFIQATELPSLSEREGRKNIQKGE